MIVPARSESTTPTDGRPEGADDLVGVEERHLLGHELPGVTSSASMPHALADDIRRRSSSIRSSVRATSKPPDSVKTPISLYCRTRVERQVGDLAGVVDREDEVRGVPGRAAGVGQRALVDLDDVGPAEPGQVVDEAVADDAGADDDDAGGGGDRGHGWLLRVE